MSTRPQPLAALDRALATPAARTFVAQSWTKPGNAARHMAVTTASLAMAGLLGACAGPQGTVQDQASQMGRAGQTGQASQAGQASSRNAAPIIGQAGTQGPAQTAPAPAVREKSDLPIVGALKNAEVAVADYARARRQEATLREALQSANDAALVARHRSTTGAGDFMLSIDAEKRLQLAQRNLTAGEAYTRATRDRMYRAFGISSGDKVGASSDNGTLQQVSTPATKAATPQSL